MGIFQDKHSVKISALTISKMSMLLSAIFMGFVGIFIDLLSKFPIYTIVFYRGLFGTFFLSFFMLKEKVFSLTFLKEAIEMHKKSLILVGITNPIVILFYFINISISGYATAAFLLYTNGIFLLIILYITKEDKNITLINVISFLLAIIGILIIMEVWNGKLLSISIITGLLSSISLAFLNYAKKRIYNKRASRGDLENSDQKQVFDLFLAWWATLILCLFYLPFGFLDIFRMNYSDLLISFLLGLIPTALAFTLYNIGIRKDKGGNIIILAYFEPIVATINTAFFRGVISFSTIIGGMLILIANILILKITNGRIQKKID